LTASAPAADPAASAAPPPPPWSAGAFDVVVTDLDRTFTDLQLALDPEALAIARRLRQAGVACILATGRRAKDLEAWTGLRDAFDGFVLECGAVWGTWDDLRVATPDASAVQSVARAFEDQGCLVEQGLASCSVPADWAARLERRPERPLLSVQPNRDRIDIVPAGIDKAVGLRLLLDHLRPSPARRRRILSVGDGENDLAVFAAADESVAVANAAPVVRDAATVVAPHAAAAGFMWAVKPLLGAASTEGKAAAADGAAVAPRIPVPCAKAPSTNGRREERA
jgi:hydroxymethylpyrimidine pyrophosphatase-like HAD family hydrolase